MLMMTELCQILRNWFDRGQKKWHGKFKIQNNAITFTPDKLRGASEPFLLYEKQYFRIIGSLFNDGVHIYGDFDDYLTDEEFSGSVWAMAVPPSVIALCEEIEEWQNEYGGINGVVMSPYASESFGGYSYSKASGSGGSANGGGSSAAITWQNMFASRLNAWRKI